MLTPLRGQALDQRLCLRLTDLGQLKPCQDAACEGRQPLSGTAAAWHARVAASARGARRGVVLLELAAGAGRPSLGEVIQGCWAHRALRTVDLGSVRPPGAVDRCQQPDRPGGD